MFILLDWTTKVTHYDTSYFISLVPILWWLFPHSLNFPPIIADTLIYLKLS
jgi:hypothetical protein